MKILYLKLHNFAHIYSGLGVKDVCLDFYQNDKVINILIGKMGSCKTVILGHLQPFANFGTIDSRNQDGVVIPGENGYKELHIRCDNHIYKILHTWTWRKDHHLLRSLITEDDKDLNPSGSVSNFKLLIETKLGLDQNMLTLLRLGPNVTNMIDMSAGNRKTFMANLLQDTEVYTMLYKKLNEDYRTMTAQASVMANRLAKVSRGNIQEIRDSYQEILDQIEVRTKENDELRKDLTSLDVEARTATSGISIQEFTKTIQDLMDQKKSLESEISEIQSSLDEADKKMEGKSVSDILVELGSIRQKQEANALQLATADAEYNKALKEEQALKEKLLIAGSQDQVSALQAQYDQLKEKYEELSESVANYSYLYDSTTLRRMMTQIRTINILISDIVNYNPDSVAQIAHYKDKALGFAKHQMEILTRTQAKLQRKINNLEYLKEYKPDEVVFFPPDCPTMDCPYYRTHPVTVKAEQKTDVAKKEAEDIKKKLSDIDAEMGRYGEFAVIISKLNSLSILWADVTPILRNIHVLITERVTDLFTTLRSQVWYDHDLLIQCIEKSENYEAASQLKAQLLTIEKQIQDLTDSSKESLQEAHRKAEESCEELYKKCFQLEGESHDLDDRLKQLNDLLSLGMDRENKLNQKDQYEKALSDVMNTISSHQSALESVKKIQEKMEPIRETIFSNEKDLTELEKDRDKALLSIREYDSTSKDLQKIQEDQQILRYIVDAVSSSKGIPLVYIQLFLKSCKEVLNSLLYDVFGDQLEILDFVITQDEFKIPYAINGTRVEDIAKASQGQRSIISLALSFALIRQAMTKYNILLLDEMDGPLYVSDRTKFLDILYKQIAEINAEQIFLVSHNNTFDGHSVNIIMTTEENVEDTGLVTVMRVCGQGGAEKGVDHD